MAGKQDLADIQRKHMEAAMHLAQFSMEKSQRIFALHSQLAQDLLQASVSQLSSLPKGGDAGNMLQQRAEYAQNTTQKLISTAQEVAKIGNETAAELSRMATEQLATGGKDLVDAFKGLLGTLPGQNTNVAETLQTAVGNANSAFQQIATALASGFQPAEAAAPKTSSRAKKHS